MLERLLVVLFSIHMANLGAVAHAESQEPIVGRNVPYSETDVEWGRAEATLDVPVRAVMRILLDYAKYNEFLPHFEQSRVLSRRGSDAMVYLEAKVLRGTATLWAQMRIRQVAPKGRTRVVEGHMLRGNMDHFLARWEVTPADHGEKTHVAFQILVDPDLPLPSTVFSKENRKAAAKTLIALRKRLTVLVPH